MQSTTGVFSRSQGFRAFAASLAAVIAAALSAGCGTSGNTAPAAPSVATAVAAAKPGGGGGGGNPSGPISVTTTIADSLNGVPLSIRSDGAGPYSNTSPTQSIIAYGTGDNWMITTYTIGRKATVAGTRSVYFDLSAPVDATTTLPTGVPQQGLEQAHLVTKCDMLAIPAGTTTTCTGDLRFDPTNTTAYRLSFAPNNYPEVSPFQVTCTAAGADTLGCAAWTITNSATSTAGKGVQKLVQIDPVSESVLGTFGDYYISVSIRVTRP